MENEKDERQIIFPDGRHITQHELWELVRMLELQPSREIQRLWVKTGFIAGASGNFASFEDYLEVKKQFIP